MSATCLSLGKVLASALKIKALNSMAHPIANFVFIIHSSINSHNTDDMSSLRQIAPIGSPEKRASSQGYAGVAGR